MQVNQTRVDASLMFMVITLIGGIVALVFGLS